MKSWKVLVWVLVCGMIFMNQALAQHSGLRTRVVQVNGSPMRLDSLSVWPESLQVLSLKDSLYTVNFDFSSGLFSLEGPESPDSVAVQYRVLPYRLDAPLQHRNLSVYDSFARFEDPVMPLLDDKPETIFHTEGVTKSGIFSRGISFGNKQDVFVNSVMNLSMEGKLTDDIKIRGNITDQQVPYQPEGNTQQLQDFDRVYFEIYGDSFSLKAGDVVLKNDPSHFLHYRKSVQGGQAQVSYRTGENSSALTKAGAAVARGKFASVQLEPQEGVLGPYKLQVPQQGLWVMIMSNSEKVFLNGKLLTRGFDQDYVIDYNLGEITFTEKILITRYSRIRVDFEYSDQNYSRAIFSATHQQKVGKFGLSAQFYREKDNPNRPLNLDLSQEQMLQLSKLGDTSQSLISGVDSIGFQKGRILYKKNDSLTSEGKYYTFYEYSNEPDFAVYQLKFTRLGVGKGNYVLRSTSLNGRVFDWVAPVNGVPQGEYEPVIEVPLPDQKQLFVIGADYKLSAYEKVYGELALSDHDQNLYSDLQDENNQAQAFRLGYVTEKRPFSAKSAYVWSVAIGYEQTGTGFQAIDRFREVEYDRNWNLQNEHLQLLGKDRITTASFEMSRNSENRLRYQLMHRDRDLALEGWQHQLELSKSLKRIQTQLSLFQNKNQMSESRSLWQKAYTDIHYKGRYLKPGYQFSTEKHAWSSLTSDSLIGSRQNFDEHKWYIKNGDSLKTQAEVYYSLRTDRLPEKGSWELATEARTAGFSLNRTMSEGQRLTVSLLYRKSYNQLENLPESEKTLLGRLNWNANFFNKHLKSQVVYQLSNSRELKREFVFLQVPGGQGTHTWRDNNEDGIQDMGEFYEALFGDERNYIKVFVPTDEFVPAFSNTFTGRLNLDFPREWQNEKGWKSFISRFSAQTSWSSMKKTSSGNEVDRFLPWVFAEEKEALLGLKQHWNGQLFFNRIRPLAFNFLIFKSQLKQLLTQGYEWKDRERYQLNARWTLSRSFMFKTALITSQSQSVSDFLKERNYTIESHEVSPEVSWRALRNLRLSTKYRLARKQNIVTIVSGENAFLQEAEFGLRYNRSSSGNLQVSSRFIRIAFEGKENSPVGYELLEGLRPGNNYLWSATYQHRLINGLQLSFIYDGRKSFERAAVHIGRMKVSALF